MKPFAEFTPADIQKAGIVRFITPLMIAKLIPTFVVTSPGSSFTITGGVIGTKSLPGWTAIAEYASAAEGVTRGLAVGLAPVRVNCVSPGSVMTEMHAHDPKQMIDYLTNATLTKRLGRPEDMAEGYLYSIKDRYVSGAILNSNGGALLV
jgi:NAD(P)-dependent dehydrogenase (short-subunit alcohol dehydrogenase family)